MYCNPSENLEGGVQITADLVWSPSASEQTGSIPEDARDAHDISQADRCLLLGPSQLGGEALVLYFVQAYQSEMTLGDNTDLGTQTYRRSR